MAQKRTLEIERKFLVKTLPKNLRQFSKSRIEQGYLAVDPHGIEVRLRKKDDKLLLTAKRGEGTAREEEEIELDADSFTKLWRLTKGRRLRKTRYKIPHGELCIEVDVYSGSNKRLVVAEVEFPNQQAAKKFNPPEWFGKDVTDDKRYSNKHLAKE